MGCPFRTIVRIFCEIGASGFQLKIYCTNLAAAEAVAADVLAHSLSNFDGYED